MKKRLSWKKVLITLLIIILLIPSSLFSYVLLRHYVFYPRTVEDVVKICRKMKEKGIREKGRIWARMYVDNDGIEQIGYSKSGIWTYKNTNKLINRISIKLDETATEEDIDKIVAMHHAEIVEYYNPNSFTIELKKNHTLNQLERRSKEIKDYPLVVYAYTANKNIISGFAAMQSPKVVE